ncbi:MAG: hypothetical protein KAS30_04885, partial [Candidatus Diapherotrites archaeon]|nr:hypothetical protein [Candidatus Diapherotrites archaeon]
VLIAPVSELFTFASSYAFTQEEGNLNYSDIADEVSLSMLSGGVSGGEYLQPNIVTIIKLKDSKTFNNFKNHENNSGSTIISKEDYKNYSIYEMTDSITELVIEIASKDGFIIIPGSTAIDVKEVIDDSNKFYSKNKSLFNLLEVSNDTVTIEFVDVSATLSGMPNNIGGIPPWMSNVSKMVTALNSTTNTDGLNQGKIVFEVSADPETKITEIQEALNNKENLTLSNGKVIGENLIVFDILSLIEN